MCNDGEKGIKRFLKRIILAITNSLWTYKGISKNFLFLGGWDFVTAVKPRRAENFTINFVDFSVFWRIG